MPTDPIWTAVDEYFETSLNLNDDALDAVIKLSADEGLPPIAVTPTQGKFLQMLALLTNARRILEIGTLGGYSTVCMARALPAGGELVTLEINDHHAEVARKNFEATGVSDLVRIIVGPANETLARMISEGTLPFDLIFIDADKASSDIYFKAALALSRVGSVIVVDNVVRDGAVITMSNAAPDLAGIRQLMTTLGSERRVTATALQTVGAKGYDGFAIALVTS